MVNVITDNIGFTFPICLFALWRSYNFFPLFLYYCLLHYLLIQNIRSTQRWDLQISDISATCTCMWPLRFLGLCLRFSKPPTHISFPRIFHLYMSVTLFLAPTCITALGSNIKKSVLFSTTTPAIEFSSLSELWVRSNKDKTSKQGFSRELSGQWQFSGNGVSWRAQTHSTSSSSCWFSWLLWFWGCWFSRLLWSLGEDYRNKAS